MSRLTLLKAPLYLAEDNIRYSIESIESSLIRCSNKVNCQGYKKPNVSRLESDISLTLLKVPDRDSIVIDLLF